MKTNDYMSIYSACSKFIDDLKDLDFNFPCTYKPGRNSKEFEDSIDDILREKYPEKFKKIDEKNKKK